MCAKTLINFFLLAFVLSSCVNSRKAIYFNNIQDTTLNNSTTNIESVIQKSDLLNITVSSLNPEASMLFNTPNMATPLTVTSSGTTAAGGAAVGNQQLMGFLVNQEGYIKFPIVGQIHASGLTQKQLEDAIADTLSRRKLLVDPIVNVRFLNFRVTILGEVARPTTLNVANERISILEALGLAGDLTIYAKRDNVLLIRESGEKKIIKRIDLNSNDIFTSPYYYLKTNDIVYVEPRKEKIAGTSRTQQLLPIMLSGLSIVAIILTRYIK
jgi:polysaccharide export outer membrane protein